ncbi:MAG: amidohydrolase [Thermoplasmata archaeon]
MGRSKNYHGFLVEDGIISSIGDYDTIMNDSDEKVNLSGATVLPGFVDAHTHLIGMGLNIDRVDLSEADSIEVLKFILEEELEKQKGEDWLIGIDFDESGWKRGAGYPTKGLLDKISEDVPIIIKRVDGHVAVANSAALERIDVDDENIDVENGLLLEEAAFKLNEYVGITKEDRKKAIENAIERAHTLGVTSVHDIVDKEGWEAYEELSEEKDLDLRVRCYILEEDSEGYEPGNRGDYLALNGIKIFVDGSLGGHTAALEDDYSDDPGNNGMLLLEQEEIEEVIKDAEERGMQLMAHAIGDRAISTLLDAYESTAVRARELRHRIEHAEMLYEENIRRIRDLNIILSAQPNFAYKWSMPDGMNEKRLGKERLQKCNPFWDTQRSLVKMAFGSDTMPMSPLFGVFSAVNHPILEQRISAYNALQCYIKNSAYAGHDEKQFGVIEDGMKADFVVLSENPLDSENIHDIEVLMTVVNGKIVYDNREDVDSD